MPSILSIVLIPSFYKTINQWYQNYKAQGAAGFTAGITTTVAILGWIFLRLEAPGWQWIRCYRFNLFPHIATRCPLPGDGLRYLLQSLWLLLFTPARFAHCWCIIKKSLQKKLDIYYNWLNTLPTRINNNRLMQLNIRVFKNRSQKMHLIIFSLLSSITTVLLLICVLQPFTLMAQFIFVSLLWIMALSIWHIPGRVPTLILIVISVVISTRYLCWRYLYTLNWDQPAGLIWGILLILAETYAWLILILSYFQSIWPLDREPVALPAEQSAWPTVDIMITTYNEDLAIVKPGIYAALGIDWPQDKINIYILDDGNREEFKAFAAEVGVNYIARKTHEHAKAGNINHALKLTQGELVAIFDCDHITTNAFLKLTVGWFLKDPNLAIVQTPHHFFSPDPFERNLGLFRREPNEGYLFYGLIQNGNDTWNATFFCGSCGVLRRSALEKIGGIAIETVTEDAHTSLRMQRQGYTSAYIRKPLAVGLATDSLAAHIGQRIRWARGMVQIFSLDNPLKGKGLSLPQRLCYFNSILYFLSGIPRLIFLTSPLAFLVFNTYIITAQGLLIALYFLPHLLHMLLTNSRIQNKYRHLFWGDIYETVLAWYISLPTTVALINPYKGKFNVTAKGDKIDEQHVDWKIARPYLILMSLNFIGLFAGLWHIYYATSYEVPAVIMNIIWIFYNLFILSGAAAVAVETKQVRKSQRVVITMPAIIASNHGDIISCTLRDYSDSGVGIEMPASDLFFIGDKITLILLKDNKEYSFPCEVIRKAGCYIGVQLEKLSVQEHIDFVQCTFARAENWILWQNSLPYTTVSETIGDIIIVVYRGFANIINSSPVFMHNRVITLKRLLLWIISFAPRAVGRL